MFWMVVLSYAIDFALMLALWATGALALDIPLAYGGVAILINTFFYVILGNGWTERLRDHYIAMPYLLAHSAVNLLFVFLAPEIGVLMLMVMFIIFASSSLRMNLNRMLTSTGIITVIAAALIVWLGNRFTMPIETVPQRLLCGLWFALCLTRISLLGLFSSRLRETLAVRNKQLAETFAKLDELATHDELTGLYNRRAIMELLEEERQRLLRTGNSFAVALLDVDHFKHINDQFGHLVGDEVLRTFARKAGSSLRTTDRLGRYGGEEFLVLFTATTNQEVALCATERIRNAIGQNNWNPLTSDKPVTVSAGVAVCQRDETAEQLLARADTALYRAKGEGRNCVRVGELPDAETAAA